MSAAGWMGVQERGRLWGVRLVVFLATAVGRPVGRALLRLVTAYYVLFDANARRHSRAYLERVFDRVTLRMIHRHVLSFAQVTLDRFFFAAGKTRPFEVTFEGEAFLRDLQQSGRGAILLMAHLGSFEAARVMARMRDFRINVLGNFSNARMINAALERQAPGLNARLIDIGGHPLDFVFRIEDRIRAGELVATMGDRVGAGESVTVPFLGGEAAFPTGPYQLAAALGCPVYLAFGVYREPNRYELYCEPFAERVVLPRRSRREAAEGYARAYAERLEQRVRSAPYNWFNFFDFWSPEDDRDTHADPGR